MTTTQKTYGANVRSVEGGFLGYVGVYESIEKLYEVSTQNVQTQIVDAWQDANELRARLIHKAEAVQIPVKDNN